MLEFGKREWGAVAAIAAAATVGGTGWWTLGHRAAISSRDIKPTFADGTSAQVASADGTLVVPAQGPPESPTPSTTNPNPSGPMAVYVVGAVKNPGVYRIGAGGRITDAVHAAGGFRDDAQREAINLADYVRDADEIYIPSRKDSQGEGSPVQRLRAEYTSRNRPAAITVAAAPPPKVTVRPLIIPGSALASPKASPAPRPKGRVLGKPDADATAVAPSPDSAGAPSSVDAPNVAAVASASDTPAPETADDTSASAPASAPHRSKGSSRTSNKFKAPGDGVVDINTAGLEDLEKVPGVGPSTAQKILDYREQIGRFTSVAQLQDIKGIGPKKMASMQPFLVAN